MSGGSHRAGLVVSKKKEKKEKKKKRKRKRRKERRGKNEFVSEYEMSEISAQTSVLKNVFSLP